LTTGKRFTKIFALVCTFAVFALVLAGCSTQSSDQEKQQQANRDYMTQMSQKMDELNSRLETFNEAVSNNDVVAMQTQADNAYKIIDEAEKLEAPSALSDIANNYNEGLSSLRKALDAYIDLYTEINSGSFDWDTYDSRLSDVQKLYDDGISKLEEADKAASEAK
jgi:soluble cytochrome b562